MKSTIKDAAAALFGRKERLSGNPTRYLLVLGHMRSGSSLLHHLLASHPDMLGCGERNLPYNSADDLHRLALTVRYRRRAFFRPCRYMVDQVNHNHLVPASSFLSHPQIWTVFLVREPSAAISSMVRVLGKYYAFTLEDAVDHYVGRLERLCEYVEQIDHPARAAYLTYDELVQDPKRALGGLQEFLGLETPLSPRYRLFDFTGKQGDPGENIRAGVVLQSPPRGSFEFPDEKLELARVVYQQTLQVLANRLEGRR